MTKHKQELKRNDLADVLEHKLEQIKPYTNVILLGVLLVVVIVGGITWWVVRQQSKKDEMWNDFYIARNTAVFESNPRDLMTHAERFGNSTSAAWARQLAADLKLQEGARSIYSDRKEGETLVREAIALYDQVIDEAKSKSMLHQVALYGRGQAHETLLDLDAARADYEAAAAAAEPDSTMALAVERRLEMLSDPQLTSFASAFLEYDPTNSSDSSDLLPPTSSPNAPLPQIPDISFPTAGLNQNQSNNEGLKTPEESNAGGDDGGEGADNGATPPAGDGSGEPQSNDGSSGDAKTGADTGSGDGSAGGSDDSQGGGAGDNR